MDDECLVLMARAVAITAHVGQVDKAGEPYYHHLDRVADRVSSPRAKAIAFLHDVIEDTAVTAVELIYAGFPFDVVQAVQALTHGKNEERISYYVRVLACGDLAVEVKLADIADNSDPERLARLDVRTRERLERKYIQAREILKG